MNLEPRHFDVAIATPGSSMLSTYTKSLVETIDYFNKNNISYCYLNEYSSCVSEARQRTINSFYDKFGVNSTYKKIVWIDSDISWEVKDILSLIECSKDIVTGAYRIFDNFVAAHKNPTHAYTVDDLINLNNYQKIFYCGMGFMCVDFGIIENIEHPFIPIPYIFDEQGYLPFNEDVSFCIKAQSQLNKEIWLDPRIKVNHHKTQTLGWVI